MTQDKGEGCRFERGAVVRLKGNTRGRDPECFLVYVVSKDNGSKKWFPIEDVDGPAWPSQENAKKNSDWASEQSM